MSWEKAPPDGDDQDADDDDDVRAYRTEWGDLRIAEEIWRCDFDEAALSKSSSSSSSSKAKAKTSGAHHEMLLVKAPHFSQYQLFNREQCGPAVRRLVGSIAARLD